MEQKIWKTTNVNVVNGHSIFLQEWYNKQTIKYQYRIYVTKDGYPISEEIVDSHGSSKARFALTIDKIDGRSTEALKAEMAIIVKEANALRETLDKLNDRMEILGTIIEKRDLAEESKKYTPKFKKGDILMREMGSFPNECNGRVRLTTDAEYYRDGKFTYGCEYVRKDGTLAKKQPSAGVWEYQLKVITE